MRSTPTRAWPLLAILVTGSALTSGVAIAQNTPQNPILFVAQFPIAADFATVGSAFANHKGRISSSGRGGDLYIRYPDGTLRNLTAEAGYGSTGVFIPPNGWVGPPPPGFQDGNAISVRDPAVHWSGTKALFSMVVGGPTRRYQVTEPYWQLYEITGLGQEQTVQITKVPNQPADYNNVSPIYASDDRILFTSDRPRNGARHLYPQHDEYESTPIVSGMWSLDPGTGELYLLEHSPSGSFTPIVDSFGRVIFTRWDHLQRDQQADAGVYGTFNYSDESAASVPLDHDDEVFPEPRQTTPFVHRHTFNHFFPWQIHQDGTEQETLNHIGRHELAGYFRPSFFDGQGSPEEPLHDFNGPQSNPFSANTKVLRGDGGMLQIREDPTQAGRYYGTNAPEFFTHASGQIIYIDGPPGLSPEQMAIAEITHPDTRGTSASPDHSGHYRDPLPTSDGLLVAAHTAYQGAAGNNGSRAFPDPRYDFRIRMVVQTGTYYEGGAYLTGGTSKAVSYWDPDTLVQYSGPLWELQPVEVRSRTAPTPSAFTLEAPELSTFAAAGVSVEDFRSYLRDRELALVVSRNVTTRDRGDQQQPFNLQIDSSTTQTIGGSGPVYSIAHLQFFQGDLIRGIGGADSPRPGRRVIAQVMHDEAVSNPPNPGGPPGSVRLGRDGSMAALVPARRAMSWHLTDAGGTPVVRERYWISFQPGEIRVCASCHGLNDRDQVGGTVPANPPQALQDLLEFWAGEQANIFADGFESGDLTAW